MRCQSFSARPTGRRNGMVLLVVMAMLALFASVAISFVFYADSEAEAARLARLAQDKDQADIDPELLASYFLNQLIYDTDNVYSAMRGWSLARSIYGYKLGALNFTPYNGVGRSALSYNDPVLGVDNFNMINYQKFSDPSSADPTLNFERTPEYYGKVGDPNYHYVGGANPPWTAYDTNSLFLAEVMANGTVVKPSFYRSWHAAVGKAAKYTSLFPDRIGWHRDFVTPDTDATGDVKNLESGPGGNDSKWMDLGFPVKTAPNGKRYRPLFAPLIVDLSNRVNLWAHGNRAGDTTTGRTHVSNMGMGPSEVNLARAIGVPIMPTTAAGATEAGGLVTIKTSRAHGFADNDKVLISGVGSPGYDGVFAIKKIDATTFQYSVAPSTGLANSGYGTAIDYSEWLSLFSLKYGGYSGGPTSVPSSAANPGRAGAFYSLVDFDGLDPADPTSKKSSAHLFAGFQTTSLNPVVVGAGQSMTVKTPPTGTTPFPWVFFDAVKVNTQLVVDTALNREIVTVLAVSPATNTFTANFTKAHAANTAIVFSPYFGFPIYPSGWDNLLNGETSGKGLNFSVFGSTSPSFGAVAGPTSAVHEPLLRFGGTNSPALTSEVFRRMPSTFSNIRARNMVTMWSMHLDRIAAAPYLSFDPFDTTQPAHYTYTAAGYPKTTGSVTPPNGAVLPPNSEYGSDWRSNLGKKLRVNLNRTLFSYPTPDPGDFISKPATLLNYQRAVTERQDFARDIYEALVRVTGARDPNQVAGMVSTSADYMAARWLAQLAVNIVDYIDEDSNITPFNWYPAANPVVDGWVFGTELPALVLNEVYAQQDPGQLNVWLELHNPLLIQDPGAWQATRQYLAGNRVSNGGNVYMAVNPPAVQNLNKPPPDRNFWTLDGTALLAIGANSDSPVYRIEIHPTSAALTNVMRDPANHRGSAPNPPPPLSSQFRWGTTETNQQVKPASGAFSGGNLVTVPIAAAPTGATEVKNVVTITTTVPQGFKKFSVGQAVTIANVPVLGYNGTFNITSKDKADMSFTYTCPTTGLAPSGGGTATFVENGNTGFYVLGPQNATYDTANRVPNLPATFVSPQLSIPTAVFAIEGPPIGATISLTGPATVTITTKTALNGAIKKGDMVTITGVRVPGYDGTWTVKTVGLRSFTFDVPAALAASLRMTGATSGDGKVSASSVPNVTLLLRRLAYPRLPLNDTPGDPLYNPYVTVDYLDGIPVQQTGALSSLKSYGRSQPYAAYNNQANLAVSQVIAQTTVQPGQPKNTFYTHNSNAAVPFTWLTHLDRSLVNQLELLHVSAFKPHELTQQFIHPPAGGGAAKPFQHSSYALWNDPQTLLYRALELLGTPGRMAGTIRGVRSPGNINLNTITEPEIFQALCDSQDWQTRKLFTTLNVGLIYNDLLAKRNLAPPAPLPQQEGTPFQPFAAGDINRTWLQPNLFRVGNPNAHPYGQMALLQKIFNNITTTSNVFGVWWTVGYFEVVDESVRPARLGKEIGRDENRHMRHRFFAVVDRSGLELFKTTSTNAVIVGLPWNSTTDYALNSNVTYRGFPYNCININNKGFPPTDTRYWAPSSMSIGAAWVANQAYSVGNIVVSGGVTYRCIQTHTSSTAITATNPNYWATFALQPGMLLELGTDVVAIKAVAGNSFTADFASSHSVNSQIVCRGNPGPRPAYNPRRDSNVVLYMSMIQ
jgi:hypothetical protein